MSVLSLLATDVLNEAQRPVHLFNHNFGDGIVKDDLLHPSLVAPLRVGLAPLHVGYYNPWHSQAAHYRVAANLQELKDCFKVNLDVQHFKPDELTAKVVDNFVVVEGKHDERLDEHGFVSRQFHRRYKLPSDVEPDTVLSRLSSDGVLTISAQKKPLTPPTANEKVVSIIKTGVPAVKNAVGKVDENNKMEQ